MQRDRNIPGFLMDELRTLYRQTSHYFGGRVAVMLLGFASFPLFTRIFSVADYGTINLITNIVLLLTVLSKFGLQHAVQRYYPEAAAAPDPGALPRYYSTLFYGTALIGISFTLLFAATMPLGTARFLGITETGALLLACSMVLVRSLRSMQTNLWQMEGKTRLFNLVDIAQKAAVIVLTCALLFFWRKSILAFFLGVVAVECVVLVQYLPYLVRRRLLRPQMFDLGFFRSVLIFSFPLMAAEISWVVLDSGDRFFVQRYLGPEALGYYAAAYGIATYLQDVLMMPLQLALFPVCMKIWTSKGARATQDFLSRGLDHFLMVASVIVAIAVVTSRDVVVLLASEKFQRAHNLLPFLVVGLVLSAVTIYFRPGLLIHKRATKIASATAYACFLNLGMNFVLLPRIGLAGAALATMISYGAIVVFLAWQSLRVLPFRLEIAAFARYAMAALGAAWVATGIHSVMIPFDLAARAATTAVVYFAILCVIDRRVRDFVRLIWLPRTHAWNDPRLAPQMSDVEATVDR